MYNFIDFEEFKKTHKPVTYWSWLPRKHVRYKFYTLLIAIPFGKKWKKYWKCKRCQFIHKPFVEYWKKTKPIDFTKMDLSFPDFEWELILNNRQEHTNNKDKEINYVGSNK